MKRRDRERIDDVEVALIAIGSHLERGGLDDGLVFDAIRIRFIEIGEAVKGIDSALLSVAPEIPWQEIAGMRDRLTHHFSTLPMPFSRPRLITIFRCSGMPLAYSARLWRGIIRRGRTTGASMR